MRETEKITCEECGEIATKRVTYETGGFMTLTAEFCEDCFLELDQDEPGEQVLVVVQLVREVCI